MSLYKTLGVDPKADQSEIKNAYRNKARKLHPDVEGGNKKEFALVSRAYSVLSDTQKRDRYDETGIESDLSFVNRKAHGLLQTLFTTILDKVGPEEILRYNVIKTIEI